MTPEEHYRAADKWLSLASGLPFSLQFERHMSLANLHRKMAETGLAFAPDPESSLDPRCDCRKNFHATECAAFEPTPRPENVKPRRVFSSVAVPTRVERFDMEHPGVWVVKVEHPRWGMPYHYPMSGEVRPIFHAVAFTQGDQEGVELRKLDGTKLTERTWPT